MISNKRILVTGGFGFIGWHLSRKLLKDGNEVTVIDLVRNGTSGRFLEGSNLTSIVGDVRDEELIDTAVEESDLVFHMAALVGVEKVAANPSLTIEIEVKGMNNILSAIRRHGIEKLVYASSSSVYGHTNHIPSKEIDEIVPSSTYALAKLLNEERLQRAFKESGIRTSSIRYFNAYGPFQDQKMVISRFILNCMNGVDMAIFGSGLQTRDFTYIDDLVEATTRIAETTRTDGRVVNLATGEETTISRLADFIIEITGARVKKVNQPFSEGRRKLEVERRLGDTSLLESLIGFTPQTRLKRGLRYTVEAMQGQACCAEAL